ncbi:atp4 subunit B of the stator stalk of mitochondrial F1F0 ATP synthase [Pestalotiopsis sp. IQ-011]
MSGPPRIILYAELLKNIRQVSVGCSLPSDCTSYTEASLSADSQQLTVHHVGEECTLRLPAAVSAPRKLRLSDGKHLSWRLPLAEAAPPGREPYSQPESEVVAWSAAQLPRGGAVQCRGCRTTVVRELLIGDWKDLPSENWAEMMEFWHCHKPDTEGHDHGQAEESQAHLAGRGYGANSRIAGQSKIGLVDLTSLLFSEEDCTNLTYAPANPGPQESFSSSRHGTPVNCSSCSAEIGAYHVETSSVTLYKWQIAISRPVTKVDIQPQPTLANCMASMLASTYSRTGSSKAIILPVEMSLSSPSPSGESLLHIFQFNQKISLTSSVVSSQEPISAVKILYRFVTKAEADRLSESLMSDVQDVTLPSPVVRGLKQLLENSNQWLPSQSRTMKEWTVGLLERWNG